MDKDPISIHRLAIVCDAHCDTVLRMDRGIDIRMETDGHVDVPKLKKGSIDLQVFACWVDPGYRKGGIKRALRLISLIHKLLEGERSLELVLSPSDVRRAADSGRIGVMISIEGGGEAIEGEVFMVDLFYRLGVRCMGLAWARNNILADSSGSKNRRWGGLSDLGRNVVREMNRVGMLVDVSHLSDKAFWDVLEVSEDPPIATHSCARAICKHPRNMDDDMIRAMGERGGVVCVNFFPAFLDDGYRREFIRRRRALKPLERELKRMYPEDPVKREEEWNKALSEVMRGLPGVSLERVLDHIEHVIDLAGVDGVGLGSDFDGVPSLPLGLEDCSKIPSITLGLLKRGYSPEEVGKIVGGNFLRVFEEVSRKGSS
jgi:membrane dipeptidase